MAATPADDAPFGTWAPARLIPTAGIRGQEEQERRATSALLAVLKAVPEFTHALLRDLGAPKGRIRTFTEIQLKDAEGKVSIPDGAIIVERGKTRWAVLVEVKTGDAPLPDEQVNRYLDHARALGFSGVLTISNRITSGVTDSPVVVDRRKLRSMDLWHLSWWRILTEAVMQHRHRGISDPDQAWILGELIAYLDHEASGAGGFTDMGDKWVRVRDAAHNGTLRAADAEARQVVERWDQFGEYLALGLSQDLGRDVAVVRPRKIVAEQRIQASVKHLADAGCLSVTIKVPDAAAPLNLRADLRARKVLTSVTVDAPKDGRPLPRINWILRQLRDAPGDLRLEVAFANTRETTSLLLSDARTDPKRLLSPTDPRREPRTFTIENGRPLGTKRGKGRGSFIADTRGQTIAFYRDLVQQLSAWRPKAPQLAGAPFDDDAPVVEPVPLPEPEGLPEPVATATPPAFMDEERRDPGEASQPDVDAPRPDDDGERRVMSDAASDET
ncbi:MAG: stress response protein [Conexibacter sp.]|nr:stress response protein [Conexibacter sp.]